MTSSGDQDTLRVISSTILGVVDILIFMVGEMLSMFHYSKVRRAGMGFLNQSTLPWMNSFASTENWSYDEEDSSGKKKEWWYKSPQGYSRVKIDSRISSSLSKQCVDRWGGSSMMPYRMHFTFLVLVQILWYQEIIQSSVPIFSVVYWQVPLSRWE